MERAEIARLEAITPKTLICGIDVSKKVHWARFADYRGVPIGKAMRFENNRAEFEHIVEETRRISKSRGLTDVIMGMEPTGPYSKVLAWRLKCLGLGPKYL